MRHENAGNHGKCPERIRTLVVDDESLARELLESFVRRDPGLELVAAAASGSEALLAVADYAPRLILLDIQMPNLDGISVAEALLAKDPMPYIIFVTAHDSFALQAFEVAVRDYLVKPVSKARFAAAIERAKQAIHNPDESGGPAPLTVRSGDTLVSLLPSDIVWVGAANQYVEIHARGGECYVVSQSLRQFARTHPDKTFVRIHRSTLINKQHLTAVKINSGQYQAVLSDGSTHTVARSRRALLPDLLASSRANLRA